jgi:DNA repair protein RadC
MSAADKRDSVPVDDAPLILPVDVATATEATLMDMVLGLPGVASRVLPVHGLLELGRLSPFALAERAEVALPEATRLAAAFEMSRRLQIARARRPKRLRTARDVARFFQPQLAPLVHEETWVAALDAWGGIRGTRMVCRGGIITGVLMLSDVLRAALDMAAVKFAMAHNHPGGDPTPSEDDVDTTSAIEHAAHRIGLELTHHVIVTPKGRWAAVMGQVRRPLA